MVAERLSREDAKERGWLLDGFPRSFAQAQSLDKLNVRPDIFLLLDVRANCSYCVWYPQLVLKAISYVDYLCVCFFAYMPFLITGS